MIYSLCLLVVLVCVYCEGDASSQQQDGVKVEVLYKHLHCPVKARKGDVLWIQYNASLIDGSLFDSRFYFRLKYYNYRFII